MEVNSAVAQAKASLHREYEQKLSEEKDKAIAKERKLQQDSLTLTKKKDEKIKSISSKLNVAISKLQHRPSRNSAPTSATASTAGNSCTGAELYREDGEFLTREAARADKILEERNYYHEQYERARDVLKR